MESGLRWQVRRPPLYLSYDRYQGRWLTQTHREDTNLAEAGFLNSCFTRHGGDF